MIHLSEAMGLLEKAVPRLMELSTVLYGEFSVDDKELDNLIETIESALRIHKAIQVGHLARS